MPLPDAFCNGTHFCPAHHQSFDPAAPFATGHPPFCRRMPSPHYFPPHPFATTDPRGFCCPLAPWARAAVGCNDLTSCITCNCTACTWPATWTLELVWVLTAAGFLLPACDAAEVSILSQSGCSNICPLAIGPADPAVHERAPVPLICLACLMGDISRAEGMTSVSGCVSGLPALELLRATYAVRPGKRL